MRDFTVTPIERTRHDGRIVYPTQYKLALQARQSTKGQSLHNQESYESQTTVLLGHALDIGWKGLEDDIIPFIENRRKDGKIVDASGTKRVDERPTMQDLWYHIEHDLVKAVMCRGVDRLFRHIDMIEPAQFAKLCKDHHCIIITVKEVRHRTRIEVYNFHENPEDTGSFLAEAQVGADYIINHVEWMNRCKMNKAMRGEYDGRVTPVGFLLENDRYIVYEPHARVVRWLYTRYRELAGNFALLKREVGQKIAEQGYLFPPFPAGMQHPHMEVGGNGHGYTLSSVGLKSLLTNVAYIGWWLVYDTVDKGMPTERKVLRARIENNHPAIADEADFWYTYERLDEQSMPRSRYNKVGTISCDALLNGSITSSGGRSVYVYQTRDEPEKATYVIEDTKETYQDQTHGSIYVKELDRLFTDYLLAKLNAGKAMRDEWEGEVWDGLVMKDQLDYHENVMVMQLADIARQQEVASAGIDANLIKYTEEADSLEKTLHYGASKLDGKDIENFSERLARLRVSISQLQVKKRRAAAAQAELATFTERLEDIPAVWKGMELHKQRRFIKLVTEKIVLTKPAPNWLQLEIQWLWDDAPSTLCYIWQRTGNKGESWTEEENAALCGLYPFADRDTILQALPARSWSAISNQASKRKIARPYQFNNSEMHRLVSLDDAAFMAQAGIVLANPYQRAWWKDAVR